MSKQQSKMWVYVAWEILSFSMLLSGFLSGNDVAMIGGMVMAFAFTSAFLTQYVKSESKLKKALEVISLLISFGIIVYGFVITRSFILGFITFFIAGMTLFAFVISFLLPRIRGQIKIDK